MRTREMKIKKAIDSIGSILFVVGLAGFAGVAEGQGNIIVSTIVFGIGIALSIWGYQYE